jgi:hypothetical protein
MDSQRQPKPDLSVVAVTPAGFDLIRETVAALHAQAARAQIELVIVSPAPERLQPDPALVAGFWGVQTVRGAAPWREARAAGVRAALAPLVAFIEEHCLVEPGWAERLLAAHGGPWAAVGPAAVNANPGSEVSWALIYLDFGSVTAPVAAGAAPVLMGHNTCYKRETLLEYGPALDFILANEPVLHADMRAKGRQLYLEPNALVRHLNVSRLSHGLWAKYHGGRLFGAARAQWLRWPLLLRLAQALGGPLLATARIRHAVRHVYRTGRQRELLPRILPAALALLFMHGLGESVGCLFGPGDSADHFAKVEFYRRESLNEHDRRSVAPPQASPG